MLLALSLCGQAAQAEPVTVDLASGRQFTAEIDWRTDASRLWLRFDGEGMHVLRPVAWHSVLRVEASGESLSAAEAWDRVSRGQLGTAAEEIAPGSEETSPSQASAPSDISVSESDYVRFTPPPIAHDAPPTAHEEFIDHAEAPPEAQSIAIEAQAANWDADVENDGIVLRLQPLNDLGQIVPVAGLLEVEVIATQPAVRSYGEPTTRLERWTQVVEPADIGPSGVLYKLPWTGAHPEFDTRIGRTALVHARFSVAGVGVLETTADLVRIRQFSPVRDRLEQLRGRRFLETERNGQVQAR